MGAPMWTTVGSEYQKPDYNDRFNGVRFAPDGKIIASGIVPADGVYSAAILSLRDGSGAVLWEVVRTDGHMNSVADAAASDDGHVYVTGTMDSNLWIAKYAL